MSKTASFEQEAQVKRRRARRCVIDGGGNANAAGGRGRERGQGRVWPSANATLQRQGGRGVPGR